MVKDLLQLKFLEGRRTQVAAIVGAVLTLALGLNWIDQETYLKVYGFLTSTGLITAALHKPK